MKLIRFKSSLTGNTLIAPASARQLTEFQHCAFGCSAIPEEMLDLHTRPLLHLHGVHHVEIEDGEVPHHIEGKECNAN